MPALRMTSTASSMCCDALLLPHTLSMQTAKQWHLDSLAGLPLRCLTLGMMQDGKEVMHNVTSPMGRRSNSRRPSSTTKLRRPFFSRAWNATMFVFPARGTTGRSSRSFSLLNATSRSENRVFASDYFRLCCMQSYGAFTTRSIVKSDCPDSSRPRRRSRRGCLRESDAMARCTRQCRSPGMPHDADKA